MQITNREWGTNICQIADQIYRINTPVLGKADAPGFSFNQYLVVDRDPLLFHTGPRKLFPMVQQALDVIMPVERLRWVAFSHVEADECGSLNDWLAKAPKARPLCGRIAAMVSIHDMADRPPRVIADGEDLSLGERQVRWLDTPHLPHGWDCGYLFEETTRTLFCGDLFTQNGAHHPPITEDDILGPSEAARQGLDYYANHQQTRPLLEKLAATHPQLLACMHGSAWRGDGHRLLLALADALEA